MKSILKKALLFSVSLGKWFGIPIYLHWSLLAMFIIMAIFTNWWVVLFAFSSFFIVLLHELGHCYAVKKYGGDVDFIVMLPIGGIAFMQMKHYEPVKELVVAAAGPLVNVALIPLLAAGMFLHKFFILLSIFNVVLLLFNLLPAFPLDGGRIMRSLLTLYTKDLVKSTNISIMTGCAFGGFFLVSGVFFDFTLFLVGLMILYYCQVEANRINQN